MDDKDLELFFANGILVDASVKNVEIKDIDGLLKMLKERNITFLGRQELYDLNRAEDENLSDTMVEVIKNYGGATSPSKPAEWVAYFNDRFERLRTMLVEKDRANIVSLSTAKGMPPGSEVKTIAMISKISVSPVKKYMVLDIEDSVSSGRALSSVINQDLLPDQVVIIKGRKSGDAIFINDIILPDITIKDTMPSDIPDSYALFLSDVHIGSKLFAKEPMELFIRWINGDVEEYAEIAKKVRFLVINGDLVDGVGVYPGQEKELTIKDLGAQYEALYKILDRIPKNIKLIIAQGNHDATHIAEPQPRLDPAFASKMYELQNATFLSNPYQVNLSIGAIKRSLLGYHGFSLTYYANSIAKYNKMEPDDIAAIMKIQLKSRHLAPTHGSTQIMPLPRDYLVIDETPDIYATGHIHKALASKYKETVLINSSCWQYQTSYQKKYGIEPEIAKVPIVNLRDKSFQILDFLGEKVQIYKKGIKG